MKRILRRFSALLPSRLNRLAFGLALVPVLPAGAASTEGPRLIRLSVTPAAVRLEAADARQQLVVTGEYSDGLARDLTRQAIFTADNRKVARVEAPGLLAPVGNGTTRVRVTVPHGAPLAAQVLVEAKDATIPRRPAFTQHILPILNKHGCAAGACHGAFAGKNGFRLSLFGHDPQLDYLNLVRQVPGRRVNPADPARSLVLRKPTLQLPHAGGKRFAVGSRAYDTLARWIAAGARWDSKEPTLSAIEVYPTERVLPRGSAQQLRVTARFSDGHSEDVTDVARYASRDEEIATVDERGVIHSERLGDTAITVTFLGEIVPVQVLVPTSRVQVFRSSGVQEATNDHRRTTTAVKLAANVPTPEHLNTRTPEHLSYVDRLVSAKLAQLGITSSPRCSDVEFLRRASLDLCGMTPTPDEVRAFVADTDPDKRAKKIDALLGREEYAEYWATFLSDMTGNDNRYLDEKGSHRWQAWCYAQFKQNRSWAEIARGVIAATSRDGRPAEEWLAATRKDLDNRKLKGAAGWDAGEYLQRKSLDLYWRKSSGVIATQQLSYAFLVLQSHFLDKLDSEVRSSDFGTRSSFPGRGDRGGAHPGRAGIARTVCARRTPLFPRGSAPAAAPLPGGVAGPGGTP